jgi:hypothetical protein
LKKQPGHDDLGDLKLLLQGRKRYRRPTGRHLAAIATHPT